MSPKLAAVNVVVSYPPRREKSWLLSLWKLPFLYKGSKTKADCVILYCLHKGFPQCWLGKTRGRRAAVEHEVN